MRYVPILIFLLGLISAGDLTGQSTGTGAPGLRIDVTGSNEEGDFGVAIQLVVAMTILTLGPSVIMMMTCFTRIIIVLGFVRNAIGVNAAPSSQIIIGLALFLTFFVMGPIWDRIYTDAVVPYMDATMKSGDALTVATAHMKDFMILHKYLCSWYHFLLIITKFKDQSKNIFFIFDVFDGQ